MFQVPHLQAVEPESLTRGEGVDVFVHPDPDEQGLPTVSLTAPTREQLLDYVRAHWGDDDADWFREYVVDRIEELPAPSAIVPARKTRRAINVTGETWERLQLLGEGFTASPLGTPEKVIVMLLDEYEAEHAPPDGA